VGISADIMTVTSFTEDGGYRVVTFGSSEEFELFTKHAMKRIAKTK
jgi:hypothetical protein